MSTIVNHMTDVWNNSVSVFDEPVRYQHFINHCPWKLSSDAHHSQLLFIEML